MALATLTIDIDARLANLERDLGKVAHLSEKAANRMDGAFRAVGLSIAGLASGLTVGGFAAFIKSSIDAADRLNDLSKVTSLLPSQLAGIGFAAEQSGSNLEGAANAVSKLAENMGKDAEKFAKVGITAKDPIEAFKQLADVFNAIEDPQKRAAFASEALGKSWKEVAPLLAEGSKSIGEMIEEGKRLNPITDEMAKQADKFNDSMNRMSREAGRFGINAANSLLPAMNDIIDLAVRAQKEYGTLAGLMVLVGGSALKVAGVEINPEKRRDNRIEELFAERNRLRADIADPSGRGGWYNTEKFKAEAQADLDRANAELKALVDEKNAQIAAAGKTAEAVRLARGRAQEGGGFGTGGKSAAEKLREQEQQALDSLRRQADGYAQLSEVEQLRYDIAAGKYKGFEQDKLREMELLAQRIDLGKADAEAVKQTEKDKEQAMRDYARSVEEANRIIFDIDPIAKLQAEWEKLLALKEQGLLTDEQAGKAYQKTFEDIGKSGDDNFKRLEDAVRGWGSTFTDEMTKMVRTGKLNFSSLADSIINDLIRMQIQKNITDPLVKMGTSFLDGIFGNAKPNADGGVYSSAGISAYSGSVVSRPTVFPFARGIGLMGEAGPEAILPLTRINGKLGVQAQGGGSLTVIQNFTVSAPTDRRTQEQIAAMAGASIQTAMMRGA